MPEDARSLTTTVVVMGVSGNGKSKTAEQLVRRLGWQLAEGDHFHPAANIEKMRSGQPLDDEDRWPWLRSIAQWIGAREAAGEDAIVTCSALKRAYRDLLRDTHPSVWFAHLVVPPDVLRERLAARQGHYMPAALLDSQLATLEPLQPDEPGADIPGTGEPGQVADRVLEALRARRPAAVRTPRQAP